MNPAVKRVSSVVVRHSKIHGRGVFARRAMRKGAKIIEYAGDHTTWDIASRRPHSDPDDPFHTFIFSLSDGTVIDAAVRGNAARWINHSCAPNCEAIEYDDGRVFIHARRAIAAGEELTYDYQLQLEGRISRRTRTAYACRCSAVRCRGSLLDKGLSAPA
jgi:SET domain-containing protein